ncbi:MAG TPA: hypothetical protein VK131_10810 [Candidatus Acidoferrales bacterium]|nr:hypothetical protein [Candidatus Acidoferrales bacterium]
MPGIDHLFSNSYRPQPDLIPERRRLRLSRPLDLGLTLAPLRRAGALDPCVRILPGEVWRATRTPAGPATTHLVRSNGTLEVEAWGPGAEWALEHAAVLCGENDNEADFTPADPLLKELHRRHPGLRMLRSEAVLEAALPTVLEQKVVGVEARRAFRLIVAALGEPAPGPARLILPPSPAALAKAPYWDLHRFGVEQRRATVLKRLARSARRLEEAAQMSPDQARHRLLAFPGLGEWSAAEIVRVALGDADAVSLGDYHLPHVVSWALTGEPRGTDQRMLELLEPFRPHRGRVQRLLEIAGVGPPRRGPRMPLRRIGRI